MAAICFYISGHGFGHASRQIEIINAVGPQLSDDLEILVRTAAARWLFDRTVRVPFTLLPGDCDSGIVQIDSLHLDEAATVAAASTFYQQYEERVRAESALLRNRNVRLVIADAPPLACSAAAMAEIPAIVVSNFTWDWIYEGYEQRFATSAPHVLPTIRQAYRAAGAGWRLPMHGGFATFTTLRDLPFVARHATRSREDVLAALAIPPHHPIALSSFGGYGLGSFDLSALDTPGEWTIVITGQHAPHRLPAGVSFVAESLIYDAGLRYEDLVAAADAVVTKPGYGIISECVANDTAMLYASRGHFVEYDLLVGAMPAVLRCKYISQEDLLAGRWRQPLNHLLTSPRPVSEAATDGAQVAAAWILEELRLSTSHSQFQTPKAPTQRP